MASLCRLPRNDLNQAIEFITMLTPFSFREEIFRELLEKFPEYAIVVLEVTSQFDPEIFSAISPNFNDMIIANSESSPDLLIRYFTICLRESQNMQWKHVFKSLDLLIRNPKIAQVQASIILSKLANIVRNLNLDETNWIQIASDELVLEMLDIYEPVENLDLLLRLCDEAWSRQKLLEINSECLGKKFKHIITRSWIYSSSQTCIGSFLRLVMKFTLAPQILRDAFNSNSTHFLKHIPISSLSFMLWEGFASKMRALENLEQTFDYFSNSGSIKSSVSAVIILIGVINFKIVSGELSSHNEYLSHLLQRSLNFVKLNLSDSDDELYPFLCQIVGEFPSSTDRIDVANYSNSVEDNKLDSKLAISVKSTKKVWTEFFAKTEKFIADKSLDLLEKLIETSESTLSNQIQENFSFEDAHRLLKTSIQAMSISLSTHPRICTLYIKLLCQALDFGKEVLIELMEDELLNLLSEMIIHVRTFDLQSSGSKLRANAIMFLVYIIQTAADRFPDQTTLLASNLNSSTICNAIIIFMEGIDSKCPRAFLDQCIDAVEWILRVSHQVDNEELKEKLLLSMDNSDHPQILSFMYRLMHSVELRASLIQDKNVVEQFRRILLVGFTVKRFIFRVARFTYLRDIIRFILEDLDNPLDPDSLTVPLLACFLKNRDILYVLKDIGTHFWIRANISFLSPSAVDKLRVLTQV